MGPMLHPVELPKLPETFNLMTHFDYPSQCRSDRLKRYSGWELNPWPLAYQTNALTTELPELTVNLDFKQTIHYPLNCQLTNHKREKACWGFIEPSILYEAYRWTSHPNQISRTSRDKEGVGFWAIFKQKYLRRELNPRNKTLKMNFQIPLLQTKTCMTFWSNIFYIPSEKCQDDIFCIQLGSLSAHFPSKKQEKTIFSVNFNKLLCSNEHSWSVDMSTAVNCTNALIPKWVKISEAGVEPTSLDFR